VTANRTRELPGPGGGLLLGNLTGVRRDMPGLLLAMAREHGPVSRLRVGPVPMVLAADPLLVHDMLTRRAAAFRKSARTSTLLGGHLGNGLMTLEGAEHRRHRRLVQPALHTQRINEYADTMVAEAVRRFDSWADGAEVELTAELAELTLRIVVNTLFTVDDLAEELVKAMREFAYSLNLAVRGAALLPAWLPIRAHRLRRRAVRRMDALAYELIRRRRAGDVDAGDLLSMLVRATDDTGGPRLTNAEIRDELLTLFFAGHETSAAALVWACHLIAEHPQVEERLYAELVTVLGDRRPTAADLASLPWLGQVVKETLRLYPPGWLFDRQPVEDIELGGYIVRRGTIVMLSPWVVHRDPAWWVEPERFDPGRFAPGHDISRAAYLPFGDGPRTCVGNRFAETEIALVVATMVPRLRLEPLPGQHVTPTGDATLRPRGGLRMTVRRRQP
jgi:cytochrome P450